MCALLTTGGGGYRSGRKPKKKQTPKASWAINKVRKKQHVTTKGKGVNAEIGSQQLIMRKHKCEHQANRKGVHNARDGGYIEEEALRRTALPTLV